MSSFATLTKLVVGLSHRFLVSPSTGGLAGYTDLADLVDVVAANHNHDAAYAATAHNHDAAYAATGHNHDAAYAATAHNHDAAYASLTHDHTEFLTEPEILALPGFGGGGSSLAACLVMDKKPVGIHGGTFTAGGYRVRDLNTIAYDGIGVMLANNQVTLPAGTYRVWAALPGYCVNSHIGALYNITQGAYFPLYSINALTYPYSYVVTLSLLSGTFTIGVSSVIELHHVGEMTCPTLGFGVGTGWRDGVFSVLHLVREVSA